MVRESDVGDSRGFSQQGTDVHALYPQLWSVDHTGLFGHTLIPLHPAGPLCGCTLIPSSILLGPFAGTP